MKTYILSTILFLFVIQGFAQFSSSTITISGKAYLWGETDHSGIKVKVDGFVAHDSTTTASDGSFSLDYTYQCALGQCDNSITITVSNGDSWSEQIISLTGQSTDYVTEDITLAPINLTSDICMITHDTLSPYPIIVWERPNTPDIDYYIISRRNANMTYDSIDNVSYNDISVYEDLFPHESLVNRYKITPVLTNGNKLPSSTPRSALKLKVRDQSVVDDTLQISLTLKGFSDYSIYNLPDSAILCKSVDGRMYSKVENKALPTLMGFNVGKFSELSPTELIDLGKLILEDSINITVNIPTKQKMYFQIAFINNTPCIPTDLKSDSGPYSQSLSNITESEINYTSSNEDLTIGDIVLSKNPANSEVIISVPFTGILTLITSNGSIVLTKEVSTGDIIVPKQKAGIYKVVLTGQKTISKTIIFE